MVKIIFKGVEGMTAHIAGNKLGPGEELEIDVKDIPQGCFGSPYYGVIDENGNEVTGNKIQEPKKDKSFKKKKKKKSIEILKNTDEYKSNSDLEDSEDKGKE